MIAAACIRRPVATTLLTVGVVLLGIVAYVVLPIAALPSVDRPVISVFANLPGASSDTMASSVGLPLERELGIISGITDMQSISSSSGEEIDIQFSLQKSLDSAAGAVQAAMNAARPNLPTDLPQPPTYYKADPGGVAMIVLALTSDVLPSSDVYNFANSVAAQRLSEISGVSRVVISGADRSAVRVRVNPNRIATMGVSLEAIRSAIDAASHQVPKGSIVQDGRTVTIAANDQLYQADDFRQVVVSWVHGAPVVLGDVAEVSDNVLNDQQAGWFGRAPAVSLLLFRQPDANIVETVEQVLALLPQLRRVMPAAMDIHVVFDRTTLIRASVADVKNTIAIATILVVIVIAAFLGRLYATLIPAVTIPVALAGTLGVMSLLGFSLDNLSLMALTIAVGFVVDDAIIIIESVIARVEHGASAVQAALDAVHQLRWTIGSITAALVSALIPVLFMPDIVGRYFREFGLTLVGSIVLSAVIALTLTPMLCSRLPERQGGLRRGPRWVSATGSGCLAAYRRSLDWTLRHHRPLLAVPVLLAAAAYGVYAHLPKGFMPTQDTGVMHVQVFANPNVSFEEISTLQRQVDEVLLSDPAVDAISAYVGNLVMSTGNAWVGLKPLAQRRASISEVIGRLRPALAKVDGVRVTMTPVQDLNLGLSSASRYTYRISGTDPGAVMRVGEAMRRRMTDLPELVDVIGDVDARAGLQAGLSLDRVQAGHLGVTPQSIDNTLYDAFGQRQIGLIFLPMDYSKTVMEVEPRFQTGPTSLADLYVPGGNKAQVPLSELTEPWRAHAPMWLHHAEQFASMTIAFDVAPGTSIGQAISAINAAQRSVPMPGGVRADYKGEAEEAGKTGLNQALLFLAAVIAIYIVLGALYESYVEPLTILSTLPSAAFGALAALWLTHTEFTLVTAIACVLVVGITMKNAILLVDFALNAERSEGLAPLEAIRQAAVQRVRPITMTALVTLLSVIPLAVGLGPGHELRQPLGIAVVGGLLLSQFVTLYSTPVIHIFLAGTRSRRR